MPRVTIQGKAFTVETSPASTHFCLLISRGRYFGVLGRELART